MDKQYGHNFGECFDKTKSDPLESERVPEEGCESCKRKVRLFKKSRTVANSSPGTSRQPTNDESYREYMDSHLSPLSSLSLKSDEVETKKKKLRLKKNTKLKTKPKVKSYVNRSFTSNIVDRSCLDLTPPIVEDTMPLNKVMRYSSKKTILENDWEAFDSSLRSMQCSDDATISRTIEMHTTHTDNTRMMDRLRRTHSIYPPVNPLNSIQDHRINLPRDLGSLNSNVVSFNSPLPQLDSRVKCSQVKETDYNEIDNCNVELVRYKGDICHDDVATNSLDVYDDNYGSQDRSITKYQYIDDQQCSPLSKLSRHDLRIIGKRSNTFVKDKLRNRKIKRKPKKNLHKNSSNSMVVAAFSTDSRNKFTKHELPSHRMKTKKHRYHENSDYAMNRSSVFSVDYEDDIIISKRSKITLSKYDLSRPNAFGYKQMMYSSTDISARSSVDIQHYRSVETSYDGGFDGYVEQKQRIPDPTDNITSIDREIMPAFDSGGSDEDFDRQGGTFSLGQRYATKGVMRALPTTPSDVASRNNYKSKYNYEPDQLIFDEQEERHLARASISNERIISDQNISPDLYEPLSQPIHDYYTGDSCSEEDYADILDMQLPASSNHQLEEYTNDDMLEELDNMQRMLATTPRASETLLATPSSYYTRLTFDEEHCEPQEMNTECKYEYWNTVFESPKHDVPLQDRLKNLGEQDRIDIPGARDAFDLNKFADVPAFALERFKSINENVDIGEIPTVIEKQNETLIDLEEKKSMGSLPMQCSNAHLVNTKLPAKYTTSSKLSLKSISQISIGSMPGIIKDDTSHLISNKSSAVINDQVNVNENATCDDINTVAKEDDAELEYSKLNISNQISKYILTSQPDVSSKPVNETIQIGGEVTKIIHKNLDKLQIIKESCIQRIANNKDKVNLKAKDNFTKGEDDLSFSNPKITTSKDNQYVKTMENVTQGNGKQASSTSVITKSKDMQDVKKKEKLIKGYRAISTPQNVKQIKSKNIQDVKKMENLIKSKQASRTPVITRCEDLKIIEPVTNEIYQKEVCKPQNTKSKDIKGVKTIENAINEENSLQPENLRKTKEENHVKRNDTNSSNNLTNVTNTIKNIPNIENKVKSNISKHITFENNPNDILTSKHLIHDLNNTELTDKKRTNEKYTAPKKATTADPLFAIISGDSDINIDDTGSHTRKENRSRFIKAAIANKPGRVNSMPNRMIAKNEFKNENNKLFLSHINNETAMSPFENSVLVDKICGDILGNKENNSLRICEKRSFQIIDPNQIADIDAIDSFSVPKFNQQIIVNAIKEIKFDTKPMIDIKKNEFDDDKLRKKANKILSRQNKDKEYYESKKTAKKKINIKKHNAIWDRKGKESLLKKVSSLTLKERRNTITEHMKKDSVRSVNNIIKSPEAKTLEKHKDEIHRINDTERQMKLSKITTLNKKSRQSNTSTYNQSTQVRIKQVFDTQVAKEQDNNLNLEIDVLKKENEYSKKKYLELRKSDQDDIQRYKNIIEKLISNPNSETIKDKQPLKNEDNDNNGLLCSSTNIWEKTMVDNTPVNSLNTDKSYGTGDGNGEYMKKFLDEKKTRIDQMRKYSDENKKGKCKIKDKNPVIKHCENNTNYNVVVNHVKESEIYNADSKIKSITRYDEIKNRNNSRKKYLHERKNLLEKEILKIESLETPTYNIPPTKLLNNKDQNKNEKINTKDSPTPPSNRLTKDCGTQIYNYSSSNDNLKNNSENKIKLKIDNNQSDDGLYIASFFKTRENPYAVKKLGLSNIDRMESHEKKIENMPNDQSTKWSRELLKIDREEPELFESIHRYNNVPKRQHAQDKLPVKANRVKKIHSFYATKLPNFEGKLRYYPDSELSSSEANGKVDDDDDLSSEKCDSYFGFSPTMMESGDSEMSELTKLDRDGQKTDWKRQAVKEEEIVSHNATLNESARKASMDYNFSPDDQNILGRLMSDPRQVNSFNFHESCKYPNFSSSTLLQTDTSNENDPKSDFYEISKEHPLHGNHWTRILTRTRHLIFGGKGDYDRDALWWQTKETSISRENVVTNRLYLEKFGYFKAVTEAGHKVMVEPSIPIAIVQELRNGGLAGRVVALLMLTTCGTLVRDMLCMAFFHNEYDPIIW